MSHSHAETLPKGALWIAGALVGFALLATATVRLTGTPPNASPVLMREAQGIQPVKSRTLRFIDTPDGGVDIIDARSNTLAQRIQPGLETGFVRGVMRGLARERRMHGVTDAPGFELTLWKDGELSLRDTATGRMLELNAFGVDNRKQFAALLDPAA